MNRRFIDVVPFTDRWLPLALTLEFVLIQALQPAKNIAYRDYGVIWEEVLAQRPATHEQSEGRG